MVNIFVTNTILLLIIGAVWVWIVAYIYHSYIEEINPMPKMNDNYNIKNYKVKKNKVNHINCVDVNDEDIKIICK